MATRSSTPNTQTGQAETRGQYDPQNPYSSQIAGGDPQATLNWMTWELQHNPHYQLDTEAFVVKNGQVQERQPGFLLQHPWLIPVIGAAAGFGIASLAGAAGASGAATAGAGGTLPSTATVGSTGALAPAVAPATDFAAGTTTAAAGGGGGLFGALSRFAGPLGQTLTNAAAYDAQGRRQDAANNARAIAENNAAKVQAAQFNLGLPSVRTNQVARGEVLNTMKDAPLTGDPRIDKFNGGGLVPSAFGPQSRAAGAELARQATEGLMNPSQDRVTPQEIPPYSASGLDNALGGAGLGLDIFSLLSKYGSNPNGTR